MGLVQKAIIDSMNFRKRTGPRYLSKYLPMLNSVQFYAYQDRWEFSKKREFDFHIYTRG